MSLAEDQPPSLVPGFHILRKIGEGRFGSVWLAREQNTGKQVAIKFYAHRRGVDWSLLGREVEKLAVLYTSRSIVGLLSVGWDHDPPYYVMEYLANGSLAERLEKGPLPVADAVRMATRIAQALVHAHGSGILHCDLKPANVLLDHDWEPRLCDFGQSRLADERSPALGTLFYMAPEQADLKAVPDARWDVYGLGALLYHMVTGSPPYCTPESEAKLRQTGSLDAQLAWYRQIVLESPKPQGHRQAPGMDSALAEIIDRCLSVLPSRRFPNAQAVLDRLSERERQRARRPVLLLGLVLPLVLLLSIAPLASKAMYVAVTTARENLTQRALESDALTVHLLASSLERELVDRREELLQIVERDEFRSRVEEYVSQPLAERQGLMRELDEKYHRNQNWRKELGRSTDASWFLMDHQGIQRWHQPPTQTTVDEDFSYRDYFHGLDEEYSRETAPEGLVPIREPRISRVYLSTSTGRFRVAVSVPIWDTHGDRVIGVLARSIDLGDLLADYEQSVQSQGSAGVGRVLGLIDSRDWRLIAHTQLKRDAEKLHPDDIEKLEISPELRRRLNQFVSDAAAVGAKLDRMDDYVDPLSQLRADHAAEPWLAAFSPVGQTGWAKTGWVAVVQERRAAAWKAVEDLQTRMLYFGLTAIVVVIVVVGSCWWLIVRIVNERPVKWWPFSLSPGNLPTASQLIRTPRGGEGV